MTNVMESVRRRRLLATVGASLTVATAGCEGFPEPGGPWRQLTFGTIQVEEEENGWVVSFTLRKQHQGSEDLKAFHDVRVHGYGRDRTEVCSKRIGTIEDEYSGGNGLPVEMECSAFPTMLTYSVAESICADDISTEIKIAVYGEENGWLHDYHDRDCGEGLPPEPRDPDPIGGE
jgi:hypothetical protein